jgi:sec-independent protein translocase protein TatA
MFGSFGWMELLLILIIVLIIFGAGKLPQLGEGLGKAIKGFKKSVHEADAIDVTPGGEQAQSQATPSGHATPASESTPPPGQHATQPGQMKQG